MGEDEDEVEDGDEGDAALLGLTSTSFFSFRSTCLLFVPGGRGNRRTMNVKHQEHNTCRRHTYKHSLHSYIHTWVKSLISSTYTHKRGNAHRILYI